MSMAMDMMQSEAEIEDPAKLEVEGSGGDEEKWKILVVDDESGARGALTSLLTDAGFDVRAASDGLIALNMLENRLFEPDLILTDVIMPRVDGIELVTRSHELRPDVICIVMTAAASVEVAVEAMKSGATDFLTKPLNFDAVELVLERAFEQLNVRRELEDLRRRKSLRAEVDMVVHPPDESTPTPRILVAGEQGQLSEVVGELARQSYLDVVEASTVDEAVERLQEDNIRAALVVMGLDGLSAEDLADRLRRVHTADIPVAFIGDEPGIEERVDAGRAGAAALLTRPTSGVEIHALVEELIDRAAPKSYAAMTVGSGTEMDDVRDALVSDGAAVKRFDDALSAYAALDDEVPDIVVVSSGEVGSRMDGLDFCRAFRTVLKWDAVPLCVVDTSREPGSGVAAEAFAAGADDVVRLPVDSASLAARLKVRLRRGQSMRERGRRDTLSGLWMREPFAEAFTSHLSESLRHGRPIALAMIDIDDFKDVNDTFGHMVGDRVIRRLGHILRHGCRLEDFQGRWGGEEFVIGFPSVDAEIAIRAVQRLLDTFADETFEADDGSEFQVTFSAGVASFPEDGESMHALLEAADERLYHAKASGKSMVVGYDITS